MTDWQTRISHDSEAVPTQRYNPNMPYVPPPPMNLNPHMTIFLKALEIAIQNGWTGWKEFITYPSTIGLEAETLLKECIRLQKPLEPILFSHEFNRFLWHNADINYEEHMKNMVVSKDRLRYIAENI